LGIQPRPTHMSKVVGEMSSMSAALERLTASFANRVYFWEWGIADMDTVKLLTVRQRSFRQSVQLYCY